MHSNLFAVSCKLQLPLKCLPSSVVNKRPQSNGVAHADDYEDTESEYAVELRRQAYLQSLGQSNRYIIKGKGIFWKIEVWLRSFQERLYTH